MYGNALVMSVHLIMAMECYMLLLSSFSIALIMLLQCEFDSVLLMNPEN